MKGIPEFIFEGIKDGHSMPVISNGYEIIKIRMSGISTCYYE